MTLNDYNLELKDARAAHNRLAFPDAYPYEAVARAAHEAHVLRAHARLMKASRAYTQACEAVLAKYADEVVDLGGAA